MLHCNNVGNPLFSKLVGEVSLTGFLFVCKDARCLTS
jgi:hypothetical protein